MVHLTDPGLAATTGSGTRQRRCSIKLSLAACISLAALTAVPLGAGTAGTVAAQAATQYQYTLVDLGTFGGPQAGQGNAPYINNSGVVVGTADTATTDPYAPNDNNAFNGDPYVQHAFLSRGAGLVDLGALGPEPTDNSSYPAGVNAQGDAAGLSDNGQFDPLTGTAAVEAVLWAGGKTIALGTLGGHESQAFALNNHDQVAGVAANTVSDPFSMLGWGTQARAFLWQHGRMRDLGTLGGPDSFGWFINGSGQIAGVSYTSATPNPVTGQPQVDVFLWQHGTMRDLGSLGGSVPVFGGVVALNSRGEIVGQSNLAGDQTAHPFLWNGTRMIDLGTLGGDNGTATAINKAGTVVGMADLANQTHHGFLWQNGKMHDLPPVDGAACSNASSVNARGEAVGNATNCQGHSLAAVLWRQGVGVDLNALVAPSALHLTDAISINDRGDIIGEGRLPNGDEHNFLLIPNNHQ